LYIDHDIDILPRMTRYRHKRPPQQAGSLCLKSIASMKKEAFNLASKGKFIYEDNF